MSYSFRIRLRLPQRLRIGIEADSWQVTDVGILPEISLRSKNPGTLISDSDDLVFRGNGYANEALANEAGETFRDAITIAFARQRIGVDFGDRGPKSVITKAGLEWMQQSSGHSRVLQDIHGLMVFESDPPPHFANLNLDAHVTRGKDKFTESITVALGLSHKLRPEERLAFDLYSASFFQPSADARLLMLMMGTETLLKPDPRSTIAQKHVRRLICRTKCSLRLSKPERDSLVGSLQWLLNESISQSGRKLAARVGSQKYLNMTAREFFTYCYNLRSKLAHGHMPRPSRDEVDIAALNLEAFLGDILSGPLLEKISLGEVTQIGAASLGG